MAKEETLRHDRLRLRVARRVEEILGLDPEGITGYYDNVPEDDEQPDGRDDAWSVMGWKPAGETDDDDTEDAVYRVCADTVLHLPKDCDEQEGVRRVFVAVADVRDKFAAAALLLEDSLFTAPKGLDVGARIRLRHQVDRFPHFVARQGAEGTVTRYDRKGGGVTLYARMDEKIEGAEDWDDEVCWDDTVLADVLRDIEMIAPAPEDGGRLKLPEGWDGLLVGTYYQVDIESGAIKLFTGPGVDYEEAARRNAEARAAEARAAEAPLRLRWLPDLRATPDGFRVVYHAWRPDQDGSDLFDDRLLVAYRQFDQWARDGHPARFFYEIEPYPLEGEAAEENCIESTED